VLEVTDAHAERPMTLYKGQHSLFRALAPRYRLNKAEFVQIYNLRPKTQVMLELIIEEVSWWLLCCLCLTCTLLKSFGCTVICIVILKTFASLGAW
jgi:hypothetical protein